MSFEDLKEKVDNLKVELRVKQKEQDTIKKEVKEKCDIETVEEAEELIETLNKNLVKLKKRETTLYAKAEKLLETYEEDEDDQDE